MDITHDSVVICLTGVPHYITDSTITMLVSTFGIAIGEVERRFYKGVDTGERYVRLKPRAHTQVPDFVTVGGCKILIRVLSNEEVCPPYTLQSQVRNNYFRRMTLGNSSWQMSQNLSMKNYELETLLCFMRIMKSCEKQSKQKDGWIYRLNLLFKLKQIFFWLFYRSKKSQVHL